MYDSEPQLRFRNQNLAATPPDHYVASWTSQEINTPPCSLTTMLHVELHKRSKPRHASDHHVACWTSQEIKAPPRPLTILLHVELHKRSKPRHALWPLCCMLNFTRDQSPPRPLTIILHVELHTRSKPRHALWSLCCMLNFTRDQSPATPSDHFVACWTSQEIKTRHPPLFTLSLMPSWLQPYKTGEQTHPLCSTHCHHRSMANQNVSR